MSSVEVTEIHAAADSNPRKIFGFDVIQVLGRGAGSHLYAATDPITHQIYALKHVVRREEKDIRYIEQLEGEFEVSQHFRHDVLRRCFDLKINRTLLRRVTEAALVMELVDGAALDVRPPDSVRAIVDMFLQIAGGLDAMHQAGYVHCDLKPNNILVGESNQVKLIDFGQTCKIGTVKERVQGTPDFIAPEQVKREPMTTRTDVFNFGATLYWALSKQKIPTLYTIKRSDNSFLFDARIPSPHEINPLVSEPLSNFTMECVKTNPAKRPQSMTELIHRLNIMAHVLKRGTEKKTG